MPLSPGKLALLVAANTALAPLAIDAYLPAMPDLAAAVGASIHRTELSISVFLVGFAIGQLVCGPLSDRLGRKPLLFSGLMVFLVASLLILQASSLESLLFWRFVQALGGGASVVNSSAIVRDCFSGREAAKVMSTMAMILMLAPLVAPALGSVLLYLSDWRLIFVFLAAYAAFLLWVMSRWLPETRSPHHPRASGIQVLRNYASIFRHREAMGYICAVAMSFSGLFAFVTASPFLYLEYFGVSPAVYPLLFGLNVLLIAASSRLNIHLLRHRSPLQNLYLGLGVQLMAASGLVVVTLFDCVSLMTVVPLIMLFTGVIGLITPNAIASVLEYFSHMSATAAAMLGAIKFTCGALAGMLVIVFEIPSIWPMVLTMFGVACVGNLALRLLAPPVSVQKRKGMATGRKSA